MDLDSKIASLRAEFEKAVAACKSRADLDALRGRTVGRSGAVRQLFSDMKKLPPAVKGAAGKAVNAFKQELEARLKSVEGSLGAPSAPRDAVDLTLPGRAPEPGRRHPVYATWEKIAEVFLRLGFDIATGPEVDTEYHNFEALNIPMDHPSRDGFDTFYIEAPWLLRSHTSPVQIRWMKDHAPPIRMIAPGKVFRPDKPDAGHSPMFHQVEGLMVGPGVTMAHLKGVLDLFTKSMWGPDATVRFRPSFFPFTEPSAEVDVTCFICGAKGCPACKQSGWVEILGSGMVHPKVLENCGIDPEANTGFAFGMGVERITMLKYGIPDIRLFMENRFSFLEQF